MPSTTRDKLAAYRRKRTASRTPEPFGGPAAPSGPANRLFVVQQHQASHLHWDLRLEIDGVLRSWAVPKGPSPDPGDRRFAALVEDHPIEYADFEGRIPQGNYGAGYVIVWDRGTYLPLNDFDSGFAAGKLLFELRGHKLHGRWTLVRTKRDADAGKAWLLIKEHDEWARQAAPADDSVLSGLTLEQIADPRRAERNLKARIRRLQPPPPETGPLRIRPMLARAGEAFDRAGWLFEIKYDGYRLMIEKDGDAVVLRSRNGHDLTDSFPELALCAHRLPFRQFVIDGEVVVHDERGVPSFALLQQRMRLRGEIAIRRASRYEPVTLYAFDLPQAVGFDLREQPLIARKALLRALLPSTGPIRYSDHVADAGRETFARMAALGLEGIVAKRAASRYRSGRGDDWIKVRTRRTGDFVIAGWIPGRSNANDLGSLIVAEYRHDALTFAGRVGSGLTGTLRTDLAARIDALGPGAPLAEGKGYVWIEPRLVCEVEFKEYTRDGRLRQPVFVRLRDDKSPEECVSVLDDPAPPALDPAPRHEVVVTNRDKVFFPEKNLTKGDLVDYYEKVSPWMLHYLRDRPLVLTRYPDGIYGKSFYQRDAPEFVPDWIQRETLYSGSADREVHYFVAQDAAALEYLANLGTIPIHTWHSRITDLEHPDWCVLDLDPKTAPFANVIEVAKLIRDLLEELALPGFLKTSGATGLHILVPLARRLTHDQSRTLGELLARVVVARRGDLCTIARSVRKRGSRVYVDYLQNGHGQLLVAPLSARAEPAASVSMPVKWSELNGKLSNARFRLDNAPARLKRMGDPMREVLSVEPDLEAALNRLGALIEP